MIYQKGYLARPLDAVLGNASALSVLRVLCGEKEGLSGRQIAQRAEINHQSAAMTLRSLEKVRLVLTRDYGRSILWRLNRVHFLIDEILLALFEGEARHSQEVVVSIKGYLDRKTDGVVLVGAAAKGRLAAGAPLEMMILCEHGRRRALGDALRELTLDLDRRFAIELKPVVLTKREAALKIEILDGWQLLPAEGRPSVFTGGR